MLYYLFDYLNQLDVPGAGVFQYISFRAAMAVFTSLLISLIFGKSLIRFLQKQQVGETVRDLGLILQYVGLINFRFMLNLLIIGNIIVQTKY